MLALIWMCDSHDEIEIIQSIIYEETDRYGLDTAIQLLSNIGFWIAAKDNSI